MQALQSLKMIRACNCNLASKSGPMIAYRADRGGQVARQRQRDLLKLPAQQFQIEFPAHDDDNDDGGNEKGEITIIMMKMTTRIHCYK